MLKPSHVSARTRDLESQILGDLRGVVGRWEGKSQVFPTPTCLTLCEIAESEAAKLPRPFIARNMTICMIPRFLGFAGLGGLGLTSNRLKLEMKANTLLHMKP